MIVMKTLIARGWIGLVLVSLILAACAAQGAPAPTPTSEGQGLPNPASVYCEEQGNRLEIRTAEDGSQSGVCVFPDGSECDEWAYYRKECGPATAGDGDTSKGMPTIAPQVQEKIGEAARAKLAELLKVDAGSIEVAGLEFTIWRDTCLGLANEGEMCADAMTPGFRVILTVEGQEHVLHTDETGTNIRQEK
jgi:putative hemolysin